MIPLHEVRCVEFVDDLTEWTEGALPVERRSSIEEHLSICRDCIRYLDQIRSAIGALKLTEPTRTRAVLPDAVLAALRERRT